MSFFNDVAAVWVKYNAQILGGVGNTMLIAIVGTLIGLLIGLLNGIIRTIPQVKNKVQTKSAIALWTASHPI